MEVEIVQLKVSGGSETAPVSPQKSVPSRATTDKKHSGFSLGQLIPKMEVSAKGYQQRTQGRVASGDVSDDPYEAWGVGGKDLERMTHPGLMNMVYNTVNGLTFYPGVLARKDMQGVVYSRLVILKSGGCDWGKTQIRSRSRYFRVYVLSVLKKTCRQNFAVQMKGLHQANVDLAFHFEITEGPGWEKIEDFNHASGNALMFYRNAQKSKLEWNFGPFKGLFPVPVVNLDFVWLKENWDRYVKGLEEPEVRFVKGKQKELEVLTGRPVSQGETIPTSDQKKIHETVN